MRALYVGVALLAVAASAKADGKSRAAAELAEYVVQRFGRAAAREGVEALATRIEVSAAKHGPEVFGAVRKVGPRALTLVEEAGVNGKQAARILSQHGEGGAAWVVARPAAMRLAAEHGDRAAGVLVKHAGGITEPVIEQFGAPAINALEKVGPQGGRRLAILMADGQLAKIGRTAEVFEVIAKYGDRACAFVWDNKGALAVGTALAAFLSDPEPFINGVRQLSEAAAVNAVKPLAEVPVTMAKEGTQEVAKRTNWTLIFLAIIGVVAVFVGVRWRLLRHVFVQAPPSVPAARMPDAS